MKVLFYALSLLIICAALPLKADLLPQRQEELRHMVLHDCGSCHGMTMKGGLGPALTPNALKDRTPEALAATVTYGRPGTPMPPFKNILSEEEINWIIQLLLEQQ